MHEASLSPFNIFVTLTYDDDHLPVRSMLHYPHYQAFMKRLRFYSGTKGVRFYMCGEYGPTTWRPHYHALLFGWDFDDKKYWRRSDSGASLYRSPSLERLWGHGNCEIGSCTFESAAYVARYCVQKVTGQAAKDHYRRFDQDGEYFLPPEFNRMSLKPGIGAGWFQKYGNDVYPRDQVVINGQEAKPPKYYDRLFKRIAPEAFDEIQFIRERDGRSRYEDNTPARLAVKSKVATARLNQFKKADL